MKVTSLISVTLMCAALMLSHVAQAQQRSNTLSPNRPGTSAPSSLSAAPGTIKYPACCDACPAGGCTGCNSGPPGLNCGTGLIKATCQTVNDVSTCVKDDG